MSLVICEAAKDCHRTKTCSHGKGHKPMADCKPMECAGQPGGRWRSPLGRRRPIKCILVKGEQDGKD